MKKDARSYAILERLKESEAKNHELRVALGEIVAWYDSVDGVDGLDPDLTEADFERYRRLSKTFRRKRPTNMTWGSR